MGKMINTIQKTLEEMLRSNPEAVNDALTRIGIDQPDLYTKAVPDMVDEQTKLYSKSAMENKILPELIEQARKEGVNLAYVGVDIDNFKRVNDTHGHQVGDQVISCVVNTLLENTRRRAREDNPEDYAGNMNVYKGRLTTPLPVASHLLKFLQVKSCYDTSFLY